MNPEATGKPPGPESRTVDIVLVKTAPEVLVQGGWYRMPLLGPGYLAAYLRAQGRSVAIVDAMFDRLNPEETVERVVAHRPRYVGFTAMTHEISRAAAVAQAARDRLDGARILVGGPHVTALPERTLEEFSVFDAGVMGEGEETTAEVLRTWDSDGDLAGVRGLVWRRTDGAAIRNAGRPWIENLDELPFPAWDLYGPSSVYQVYASRGCPFQCIFCMRVLGDRVRYRSAANVVDEVKWIVDTYQPEQIDFSDETFTLRRDWVEEICAGLIRHGLHKRVRWFANGRVNTVTEPLLRRMREAGCFRIGYGIESGNEKILRRARKGTRVEQIERAIAATKRAGLESEAFYILGFPGETRETARDTIRLAARLNTTTAAFGIMVPYPGTEVARMAREGEGGYRLLSTDWQDFDKHLGNAMELEGLPRRELERLQARAYLWFYLRNGRLRDLARFLFEKRRAVWRLARKVLRRRPSAGRNPVADARRRRPTSR